MKERVMLMDAREEGREEGKTEGRNEEAEERISDMLRRGKTAEEIVDFCGYTLEQVQKVENEMLCVES